MTPILKWLSIILLIAYLIGIGTWVPPLTSWQLVLRAMVPSVAAQGEGEWSVPQTIPGYSATSATPILLADKDGTVHVLHSQRVGAWGAVMYNNWTVERGWGLANDVIIPPTGSARLTGAYLDKQSVIHLLFFSGDDVKGNIYYTFARAQEADNAAAWLPPLLIGENAATPEMALIEGTDDGQLFVLYSGKEEGLGIYEVTSTDGGDTWSNAEPMALTYSHQKWPWAPQLIVDNQGQPHAAWTFADKSGTGEAIYYAHRKTNGLGWSTPYLLATRDAYEADWPSLVAYYDQLMVVYQNSQPATRWMRQSFDGGETWTAPTRPFPHVGEYGHAAFALDGDNRLHMVLGNRVGNPEIHGMWHTIWQGNEWRDLTPIVSDARVIGEIGGNGFDPSMPHVALSLGNQLLVAWTTDPGAGKNGVWYAYQQLDALPIPSVVLPSATPPPTLTPTHTPTPVQTATPILPEALRTPEAYLPRQLGSEPAQPLLVALLPAALLTSLLAAISYQRANRQ